MDRNTAPNWAIMDEDEIRKAAMGIADTIIDERYVTSAQYTFLDENHVRVTLYFDGKAGRDHAKSPALPMGIDFKENDHENILSYVLDEIEFDYAEQLTGWKSGTLTIVDRSISGLWNGDHFSDSFTVIHGNS